MSVSDCADLIGREYGAAVRPSDITRLFYQRELRTDLCPVSRGRRDIPATYVPQVAAVLRRRGKLRASV
jgi:hypothetical protein